MPYTGDFFHKGAAKGGKGRVIVPEPKLTSRTGKKNEPWKMTSREAIKSEKIFSFL